MDRVVRQAARTISAGASAPGVLWNTSRTPSITRSVPVSVMISVGATNLFDEDPPFVATNGGFDSKVHDPRGRLIYVRGTLGF